MITKNEIQNVKQEFKQFDDNKFKNIIKQIPDLKPIQFNSGLQQFTFSLKYIL